MLSPYVHVGICAFVAVELPLLWLVNWHYWVPEDEKMRGSKLRSSLIPLFGYEAAPSPYEGTLLRSLGVVHFLSSYRVEASVGSTTCEPYASYAMRRSRERKRQSVRLRGGHRRKTNAGEGLPQIVRPITLPKKPVHFFFVSISVR